MPEMSREFFFPKKLSLSFEKEMSRVLFLILDRSEKAAILSSLIKKTNALEMKWLLMIILKGVISLPISYLVRFPMFLLQSCSILHCL